MSSDEVALHEVFGDFDSVQVMQYCAAVLEQIDSHVVDRLAMFMTNQVSIQDVLFFPQMKREQ